MKNIYFYTYYKLYKFTVKTNKDVVEWTSMIFLSQLLFFNLFSIIFYINLSNIDFLRQNGINVMVSLQGLILFVNYLLFIRKDHYLEIIKKYSNEDKPQKIIGTIAVLIYITVSFYLFLHIFKIV